MPRYQLEIAIALDVSAALSALVLCLNRLRRREGKIRLPLHDTAPSEDSETYPDEDSFDITTAEDILNGYPLDEEKFWAQMRRRKIFLSVVLFLLVLVQAVCLALEEDVTLSAFNQFFALYMLAVVGFSINRQTVPLHMESVWHLMSLTLLAVALIGFTAILPGDNLPAIAMRGSILSALWYTALALYTLAFVLAVTTPCGPGLHYPPSAIYTEKTTKAITNREENNVSGVYGASPWSILFFSYSTKVVMLGNTAASLEIGDLPILTLDMRGAFHYASMKRALRDLRLSIGSWRPRVGTGATLAYQLSAVNYSGLVAITVLSLVVGSLFYIPPFFLSRVLSYLENDPYREHTEWGWVWVICLFGSNVLLFVVTGQLWSLSGATVQARIRAQLNTALFAKTLVRKDVASSAASTPSQDAPPTDKPKEENEFSSKAQIMTLMTTDVDRVGRFTTEMFFLIARTCAPNVPMLVLITRCGPDTPPLY
ncbi:hypothetical protein B0H13DRAFT_2440066 [Mycena leptocephala]|nr:hypothetical protein B0H13DRAFT_2440066 [Mycena leptocephala]